MNIVTIFCTSYASFDYAQKALELHAFDYYLKPISYLDLTAHIVRAVEEAEKNRVAVDYQKYGQYWLDTQVENKERFWNGIIYDFSDEEEGPVLQRSRDYNLFYQTEDRFILCILGLENREEVVREWGRFLFDYGLRNIIFELFTTPKTSLEAILRHQQNAWTIVLKQDAEIFDEKKFQAICQTLVDTVNRHMSHTGNCYYTADCSVSEVFLQFRELEDIFVDDVTGINQVYDLKKYKKHESSYQLLEIEEWETLLTLGRKDELLHKIARFLENSKESGELNVAALKALRMDVLQMIHAFLKQHQIEAYKLFAGERYEVLREKSLVSVSAMKEYTDFVIGTAIDYIRLAEESKSIIGKVKDYIEENLQEEITRASIAKVVFLNSDYLAKLFKKETGKSLGAYLLEKRIEKAKTLLARTHDSINMISQQVGYDNFSYFSRLFRDKTGLPPNEYRKLFYK